MRSDSIFIIFLGILFVMTAGVKISSLNSTRNAIGPRCVDFSAELETCNLDDGNIGQCSLVCDEPQNKDADVCCHSKLPMLLSVYFCCKKSNLGQFAVGGIRARKHEFPYMAALGWFTKEKIYAYNYQCGGAFISSKFVITAAHCAYVNGIEPVVVKPGGGNLRQDPTLPFTIDTVHVHPEYDDEFIYNDIALIELVGDYSGGVIELWRRPYIANTTFTAMGYGDTLFGGTSSDDLIKVFLDYVSNDDCQQFYDDDENVPNGIVNTQFCAKDPKNVMDTCQGDSGGPLIMSMYNNKRDEKKEYLFGITSFGQGCALSPPGVYTLVSEFTDWINRFMKPENTTTIKSLNGQWVWL